MSDDPARGSRPTAAPPEPPKDPAIPSVGQEQLFGDLSGMAREAVRSPADPRLDTHLRFLGLGDASEPASTPSPQDGTGTPVMDVPEPDSGRAALQTEIDHLRAAVARLQTTATETSDRIRQLTFVIGVLAIATVVALIIGIVR
jgi:hypothetical protein